VTRSASQRNVETTLAAVKLGIFTVVSVLVTGLLAVIMGHFGFGGQTTYRAVFTSASELKKGDDVRVAGVSVGQVKGVKIYQRDQALVTFKVDSDVPMTTASGAEVRYLNLVGDRYLALTQGDPGAPRLSSGTTIPASRTEPALNLTELFNGFQPLFQALTPADVNELSMNLVRVLQGEGGTVQSLLARTASLTNSIANRDQLVGQVIDNLSGTLQTVDAHHQQLTQLLVQMRGLMGKLAQDRTAIGTSLTNVSALTEQVARLVTDARPWAKQDIAELRRVMEILNRPANQALLSDTLARLPKTLAAQARIGTFGSWYNYYLCDFTATIVLPKLGTLLGLPDAVARPLDQALTRMQDQISKYTSVYSTAKRCDA
jgi:phospholipid/cholesterol/gamma-HCH transport system substrate-binding protein